MPTTPLCKSPPRSQPSATDVAALLASRVAGKLLTLTPLQLSPYKLRHPAQFDLDPTPVDRAAGQLRVIAIRDKAVLAAYSPVRPLKHLPQAQQYQPLEILLRRPQSLLDEIPRLLYHNQLPRQNLLRISRLVAQR